MAYTLIEDDAPAQPKRGGYVLLPDAPHNPTLMELIGNASAKGVAGLLDSVGNTPHNIANLGIAAVGAPLVAMGKPQWAPDTLPTPNYAHRALTAMNSINPNADPVNSDQRFMDSAVQGVVGGAFSPANAGRQILSNAALGALSGGTTDLVSSATESPMAGIAAGMLAPIGAAGLAGSGRRIIPNGKASTGNKLLKTADDPKALRDALARSGKVRVPGSQPTTAEVAMQPGLSQAQRNAISMGYGPLTARATEQNAARVAQLERVAPGATKVTPVEAGDSAYQVIMGEAAPNRQALKDARGGAYNSDELRNASLMLPGEQDAVATVQRFYPGKAFDEAPGDLRRLVARMGSGEQVPLQEFDALRKIAGNRASDLRDTDKTASAAWSSVKGLFDDAEAAAVSRSQDKFSVTGQGDFGPVYGNLAGDTDNAVAHLLRMQTGEVPGGVMHQDIPGGSAGLVYGVRPAKGVEGFGVSKLYDKHPETLQDLQGFLDPMRADPGLSGKNKLALRTPEDDRRGIVTLTHFNNPTDPWLLTAYEKQNPALGGVQASGTRIDTAGLLGGGDTARSPSTSSIDDALTVLLSDASAARNPPPPVLPPRDPRQYVGGLLAPDQAEMLEAGRQLHRQLVGQYETGPARDLWRTGSDGMPSANGAEAAKKFFHSGASQTADIDQFGSMLPGNPEAFDAMRKYAISDLYAHGTGQNGMIQPEKFGNWIDARGGLDGGGAIGGLFNPEQRELLGNVNADVRRSVDAMGLGRATGSNTAQNLFTAGALLDSPVANVIAGRLLGGFGTGALGMLRDSARRGTLEQMGPALLDPRTAQAAIEAADKNRLYGLIAERMPQAQQRAVIQGLLYPNQTDQ